MTDEIKVPSMPFIDFEAAWRELYQLMKLQENLVNLTSRKKEQIENPILTMMINLESKHTREVPIQ